MSNTKQAKAAEPKADQNGAADEQRTAQEAQVAEANGTDRTFEFDGYTYTLAADQPSPKAMEYVARWSVDDENMAMVLAIKEIIGADQWAAVCDRHKGDQLFDFWRALNKAAGSGN
jgi:hypothetical protein